jgi:molybdopterin-guanine dinucleotide biosynthesis protein A
MSAKRLSHSQQPPLASHACPAFILAGGRSSRFGSDKALVELEGQPLLMRLRDTLRQQGHAVSIIADRQDRYQQLGLMCLIDSAPNSGPLGGVAAALQYRLALGPGWILVLSCDQVVWRGEWFEQLARQTANSAGRLACDAVHFISCEAGGGERIEPLPCMLHTRLLTAVLARLQHRELSLQKLLASVSAHGVATEANPRQWSFNTLDELHAVQGT